MIRNIRQKGRFLAFPILLLLLLGARHAGAERIQSAAYDPGNCNVVVNPGESIQSAINADHLIICVRGGIYQETIHIPSSKPGRTLIAYGDGTPVIDGNKRLPGGLPAQQYIALVELQASGTVFDGFEVRHSSGRGLDVAASNIAVRNSSIHDNWTTGIIVRGNMQLNNILIENNAIYNNLLKVKYNPVIYRGERTGNGPTDWTFDPDVIWDTPYWSGKDADLPESSLNGLSLTFDTDGVTPRVYAGSVRSVRAGNISTNYSATGQAFSYTGHDILFHDPVTNKWTLFFDGNSPSIGLPDGALIDAFQIENLTPETLPCPTCRPILISFLNEVTMPIEGVPTVIGPSDLVRFSPSAMDNWGRITGGSFALYRTASQMGLGGTVNIDALDRAPDGHLLISVAVDGPVGSLSVDKEDLAAYDEDTSTWSLYFDGDQIPFNPFFDDLTAAWLDASGNLYVSGDPIGGTALAFIETTDGVARGNILYNNYGEGLVAGRASERIVLEDNVVYDNYHENLYLNSTIDPLVRRNLVFCTDDPAFRRKASAIFYTSAPGIMTRDEAFVDLGGGFPLSSGQIITNNIVVGCSVNFGVGFQRTGGGLNDALVANNVFANARGQSANNVNNIHLDDRAVYVNSRFINNLILQTSPGAILRVQGANVDFTTFTVAHNLYYSAASGGSLPTSWFPGEIGRVIGNPNLEDPTPPLPAMGQTVDPTDYRLTYASPALDAGQALAEVTDDFFASARGADGPFDIGAHELAHAGRIIVRQETTPGQPSPTFDFVASFPPTTFSLANGEEQGSGTLPAGVYSVESVPVENWTTTAICDDGSPAATITLGPNETVTCTFSSVRATRLTVTNVVDPAGDSQLFDFTLAPGDNFQLGSGSRSFDVLPGEVYALSAVAPDGWYQAATCDNEQAPGAVTLTAGQWATCTFTHTRLAMSATVTPAPAEVTAPGGSVTFSIAVTNSGAAVQLTGMADSVFGNVADPGNANLTSTTCSLPQSLASGAGYDCSFVAQVSGAAGSTHASTMTIDGTGPGGLPVNATAVISVAIQAAPTGRIVVIKETDPPDAGDTFAFTSSFGDFSLSHGQSYDSGPLPSGAGYNVAEIPAAGWTLSGATCAGDDDGTDPASIFLDADEVVTCTFVNTANITTPQEVFYITTPKAGTVRSLPYSPGDILAYDSAADDWSIYFDASDVGTGKALNDFVLMDDGSILMVFKAQIKLRNASGALLTYNPQDITRFVPTQIGDTTAGKFEFYFDGSDVGLTTTGERIDALAWRNDGPHGTLLLSTTAAAAVKRENGTTLKAADEDLLAFEITNPGEVTSGKWSLAFDGSTLAGMAVENVTAAWFDSVSQNYYLTVMNNFNIKGVTGTNKVVLAVSPSGVVEKYWDATAAGFLAIVDGLHIVR